MTLGPISSWQIDEEKMETAVDFIFLVSKITLDGDCSLEIKTVAPWKKSCDKPRQHLKKQSPYVHAMVFPLAMYRCDSCTIKKAEY